MNNGNSGILLTNNVSRRVFVGTVMAAPFGMAAGDEGWTDLFDGRSLEGWRPSENKGSWKVVDGMLTANGPRSHLFYTGLTRGANFRNFELQVELVTKPECNSGIYFHTAYQETGFPEKGFEIQINNTARGDGGYLERKKTGSLYGLRNMYKQLVPDEKPFQVHVMVRGKNVQIRVSGQLLVDYVEPTPPVIPTGGEKQRFLDRGTFALQCHNDGSKAAYRSVRVRPLPDNLPGYTGSEPEPVVDETYRQIINIGRHNVPMVDFHVLLRSGMTVDELLLKSRKDGIQNSVTVGAASLKSDADAERFLSPLAGKPIFATVSATDGDWTRRISRKTAQKFDCILADGRDLSNSKAASTGDGQALMDGLIDRTINRLNEEPVDVLAYATYLPATMRSHADELWTSARTAKLIGALMRNKVAIELNTLERLPSQAFVQTAKEAGCKFAFGTGNQTVADLKRCEYGLQMVEACKLEWQNFYAPGSWWPKAAERRWPSGT